jgi:BirA family transcriptional regulator, biotin operon repressor / biotin---[acetyl-CoA-carboxylase] ligase
METLFIGKNLLFLHEVDSTNTYAMNLLRNVNVVDGTLVYTDQQTSGRGQRGSLWNSEIAQNITASIIIKTHFLRIENSFSLSQISALAIYDVLAEILPQGQYDIKIKWPNDILVNKQKIAGILIENTFHHQSIQHSVIGIGLNLNQTNFPEFQNTATSLKKLLYQSFDRQGILEKLCKSLEKWYFKMKNGKLDEINQAYLDQLYGLNEHLMFRNLLGDTFSGTITGISVDGKLNVKTETRLIEKFDVKEITFEL